MVSTWLIIVALLVGAAAGWFAHLLIARPSEVAGAEPAAPPAVEQPGELSAAPPVADAVPDERLREGQRSPSEEVQRLDKVLSELERRYESRTAEGEAAARPARPRRRRAS